VTKKEDGTRLLSNRYITKARSGGGGAREAKEQGEETIIMRFRLGEGERGE